MPAPLLFYFDVISPYAYLAWTSVHALAERYGRTVEPAPVLFAALLDANGQKGPAEIPRKRIHTFKDVVRTAHRLRVPIRAPATHPFNPLLALRVASADLAPKERRALIDAVFDATWALRVDVSDAAAMTKVIDDAGLDGAGLVAWSKTQDAKDRVRRRTEEALAAGAFGVPTVVVDSELFWGFDAFPNLEAFLRGEDPVNGASLREWENLAPSALRRAVR